MDRKYILDGKTPVAVDLKTWALWFETANRVVKKTEIEDAVISTVFLGLDHKWGDGDPHLFETMVFGGEHHDLHRRCSTWDQALKQHQEVCDLVTGEIK